MKTRLFTLALSLFLTANITFAQGYIDENGDSIAVVDYKEELDVNPEYTSESTADVIWPDVSVFIIDGNGYGVTIEVLSKEEVLKRLDERIHKWFNV